VLTGVEDATAVVYTLPVAEEPAAVISFEDSNIKEISYVITAYNYGKKTNGAYELVQVPGVDATVSGASVELPSEYFEKDGLYEIRATAFDDATNSSGEKVYTYVVMRNTSALAYIPESQLEKFDNIGMRAMDFADIPIYLYIANDADFTVKIGDNLLNVGDYRITGTRMFMNQVMEYQLTIPQVYISQTFYEDAQVYDLPINIATANGQILTLGHMVVDNVKPFGEFDSWLEDGVGCYDDTCKTVRIVKLSDDIDVRRTKVLVDGVEVEYVYDADAKTITFTLEESSAYGHPWAGHNIKVTLVDTAGNEYSLPEINDVYVGSRVGRYWILGVGGGVAVAAAAAAALFKPWKKKEEVL
jgi:hypothetical protein